MSDQDKNEKTRAEKAKERYIQKKVKEKKSTRPLPFVLGALVLISGLFILFAIYIANIHQESSFGNAQGDLETMSQIGTLNWESTLKDAPWAIVRCPSGDFIVKSQRTFSSTELRNCSYELATDIRIEPVGHIWSTRGKLKFVAPEK